MNNRWFGADVPEGTTRLFAGRAGINFVTGTLERNPLWEHWSPGARRDTDFRAWVEATISHSQQYIHNNRRAMQDHPDHTWVIGHSADGRYQCQTGQNGSSNHYSIIAWEGPRAGE